MDGHAIEHAKNAEKCEIEEELHKIYPEDQLGS